jgi:hypothetical protein
MVIRTAADLTAQVQAAQAQAAQAQTAEAQTPQAQASQAGATWAHERGSRQRGGQRQQRYRGLPIQPRQHSHHGSKHWQRQGKSWCCEVGVDVDDLRGREDATSSFVLILHLVVLSSKY